MIEIGELILYREEMHNFIIYNPLTMLELQTSVFL